MLQKISEYVKKNIFICCLIPPTLAGIIITTVIGKVNFFTVMPLFVSLIVMLLQSQANRYAFLLGGINSIFYAVVDFSFTLYSSAASALLISFPFQIVTFIKWNKRAYKKSTKFRKLSAKGRILAAVFAIATYALLNLIFYAFGSSYMLIDNATLTLSLLNSVLTMLSFVEYPVLTLLGCGISIGMNIAVFINNPSRLPFLIYNVYSTICVARGMISVFRLYREQKALEILEK